MDADGANRETLSQGTPTIGRRAFARRPLPGRDLLLRVERAALPPARGGAPAGRARAAARHAGPLVAHRDALAVLGTLKVPVRGRRRGETHENACPPSCSWPPPVARPPSGRPTWCWRAGTVITLDDARPRATAVAVRDGRIVAVGGDADVKRLPRPEDARRSTSRAAAWCPASPTPTCTSRASGRPLESLDLVGAASLQEALDRVRRRARRRCRRASGCSGRGWDQNDWPEKRFPTAAELDRAAGDRPVYLVRVDGHAAWANTRALALAGIDRRHPRSRGRPHPARRRRARRRACSWMRRRRSSRRRSRRRRARCASGGSRRGWRACAAVGLTSVHDAGVDRRHGRPLQGAAGGGRAAGARLRDAARAGRVPGQGRDARARDRPGGRPARPCAPIKVVADGALGSRGALAAGALRRRAGHARPQHRGPGARSRRCCGGPLGAGLPGEHARHRRRGQPLRARRVRARRSPAAAAPRHRFRIEHAQVLAPADVPRFKRAGRACRPCSRRTARATCTGPSDRVGPSASKGAYLWKTFLDQGVPVPAGSDAPVESIAVMPGLHGRGDAPGREGLAARRLAAAGAGEPGAGAADVHARRRLRRVRGADRGTIAVGERADFTVLGRDLDGRGRRATSTTCPCALTIVGGRVVHEGGR